MTEIKLVLFEDSFDNVKKKLEYKTVESRVEDKKISFPV